MSPVPPGSDSGVPDTVPHFRFRERPALTWTISHCFVEKCSWEHHARTNLVSEVQALRTSNSLGLDSKIIFLSV